MKKSKLAAVVGLVVAITAAAWICSIPVAYWLSNLFSDQVITKLGASGDLFGVMTSFFSGLAALGIVVILVLDRENRLSSEPPLVTVRTVKATIKNASYGDDGLDLQIDLTFLITNLTAVPALNPTLKYVGALDRWMTGGADIPLAQGDQREFTMKFRDQGKPGEEVLRSINGVEGLKLPLEFHYASLNGASWKTTLVCQISVDHADKDSINKILNHVESEYIKKESSSGSSDSLELENLIVSGSWSHGRS